MYLFWQVKHWLELETLYETCQINFIKQCTDFVKSSLISSSSFLTPCFNVTFCILLSNYFFTSNTSSMFALPTLNKYMLRVYVEPLRHLGLCSLWQSLIVGSYYCCYNKLCLGVTVQGYWIHLKTYYIWEIMLECRYYLKLF